MKLLSNCGIDAKPTHVKGGDAQRPEWPLKLESELTWSDVVSQVSRCARSHNAVDQ